MEVFRVKQCNAPKATLTMQEAER